MFFKTNLTAIALFGCLIATSPLAFAGADSGFYIGAGVGDASFDDKDFDENDTGYKVFGGYNIGFIPLVDFAVEASYVDFGNPSNKITDIDLTGFDAFGLAGLSFGPFGIFAKAGVLSWDSDSTGGRSDSGSDPAYGVGARFAIGSFAVRAEYELFDIDGADVNMVSVSGVFTF